MKGLIILEGPDCCGKTTLAKRLISKYHGAYIHCGYSKGLDVWKYHTDVLDKAVKLYKKKLVCIDRHWPSEMVYGQTFRKGSAKDYDAKQLDQRIQKMAGLYVWCLPHRVDFVFEQHARNCEREQFKDLTEVVYRYYALANGSHSSEPHDYFEGLSRPGGIAYRMDFLRYKLDTEGHDLTDVIDRITFRLQILQKL